jgi:hypothetical protein
LNEPVTVHGTRSRERKDHEQIAVFECLILAWRRIMKKIFVCSLAIFSANLLAADTSYCNYGFVTRETGSIDAGGFDWGGSFEKCVRDAAALQTNPGYDPEGRAFKIEYTGNIAELAKKISAQSRQ